MDTQVNNNLFQKVDLMSFYRKNYETWKEGQILEFIPESKHIAERNSLEEYIKALQDYTKNSIQIIDKEFGFLENEVIVYANSNKLILTNKRYFILDNKSKDLKFDTFPLEIIKKIKKNGLFNLTIVTIDGYKIEYSYAGDWVKMEGVTKAMKILRSKNIEINDSNSISEVSNISTNNYQGKYKSQKEKNFILKTLIIKRLNIIITYTILFTILIILVATFVVQIPLAKSIIRAILLLPVSFIFASIFSFITGGKDDEKKINN